MSGLVVVRFAAVFSTGVLAGIFFGDRMGASFGRVALPPSGFVKFQQVQHVHFVKMMPVLMGVAILSSAAWLVVMGANKGSAEFLSLVLGTLAFVSIAILTRTINVPINNRLMTWNSSSPPADAMSIWARWERVHTVRTAIAVFGFACELLAFGLSKPGFAT